MCNCSAEMIARATRYEKRVELLREAEESALWFADATLSDSRRGCQRGITTVGEWLGGKDSNLDKQIQSLPSYRWTTPHQK